MGDMGGRVVADTHPARVRSRCPASRQSANAKPPLCVSGGFVRALAIHPI